MTEKNMELWASVEKTDPKHVKPITGKSYKGSSPNPYSLVMRATERFGPVGIGWGFTIVKEEIVDGAMIEPGFFQKHHKATVRVWYIWNNQRGEVEHIGQTEFSGRRKDRDDGSKGAVFTDEDACKKSVTDALGKALSFLGFSGDIFIGRWDDSKYQAELRREFSQQGQVNAAAVAAAQKIKPAANADELIGFINAAKDLTELNAITHNDSNIALFRGLDDAQADEIASTIEVKRTSFAAKPEPQKAAAKAAPAKATKAPAEKTPVAESGHAQAPVYDDEASREASAKMVSDLAEIAQLVAGEEPEPGAAKVELTKWAAKHSREKAMLIPEDKAIVTKSFVDLQTKIREVAHALEKAGE